VRETGSMVHVVDDDELVRDGLSRLLRSQGYAVRTFSSATAFLERRSEPAGPTCVVLDLMMPGKTGLELQDELKSRSSKVPIVFISGQTSTTKTQRALAAGATAFLDKPIDPDELLEAVAAAIDHHATLIKRESRS
jgi:FixJ family two-component response regulator